MCCWLLLRKGRKKKKAGEQSKRRGGCALGVALDKPKPAPKGIAGRQASALKNGKQVLLATGLTR